MGESAGSGVKRIQRKRTKGWRMPPDAVYVGRPTKWGNEFRRGMANIWDQPFSDADLLELYRLSTLRWLEDGDPEDVEPWIAPLRGKDLACWCPPDKPCHADVLLELAA